MKDTKECEHLHWIYDYRVAGLTKRHCGRCGLLQTRLNVSSEWIATGFIPEKPPTSVKRIALHLNQSRFNKIQAG